MGSKQSGVSMNLTPLSQTLFQLTQVRTVVQLKENENRNARFGGPSIPKRMSDQHKKSERSLLERPTRQSYDLSRRPIAGSIFSKVLFHSEVLLIFYCGDLFSSTLACSTGPVV